MKGREAARAAKRRERQAGEESDRLREQLKQLQYEHDRTVQELEAQIGRLKKSLTDRAADLAGEVVRQLQEELTHTRSAARQAEERLRETRQRKDELVRNACRYISMTTGTPPELASEAVITWMTGEDFTYPADIEAALDRLDLPRDGWLARLWKARLHARRLIGRKGVPGNGVSLDTAEQSMPERVHPCYRPQWYRDQPLTPARGQKLT
jgi:hypothetical protein